MPEKNVLFLCGEVVEVEKSHSYMDEEFFKFMLKVPRLSGNHDTLPVIVSEKLLYNNEIVVGDLVKVEGQTRTRNQRDGHRKRLLVFSYAIDIVKVTQEEMSDVKDKNQVELEGFIVKKPTFRETNSGRKITELLIASNRQHNKSDYLPSIAWGVDAVFARKLQVGDKVSIAGRFQSREYITRDKEGNPTKGIAYEISISNIDVVKEEK